MDQVYEFLINCNHYFLATIENNRPKVRPFGSLIKFENRIYIQTNARKKVSAQMKANPQIEISGVSGSKWIRISANAILDPEIEPQIAMLEAIPSLQKLYRPGDGILEVFYLSDAEASICSFDEAPAVYHF